MLKVARLPILAAVVLALSACATIVGGGSSQTVSISSAPTSASFVIKSSAGMQMASGTTPQTIRLPRKNEYQIELGVAGYKAQTVALTKGVNGWVFGNFIIGWIPGLIIDFVTGSASKLEPSIISVSLERGVAAGEGGSLFGIVRQLDESGKIMSEQRIEFEPVH